MQRHLPVNPQQVADRLWREGPAVDFVAPSADWSSFIAQPLPCFSPLICDFVAALSARLKQDSRRHPDLAAFGFWLRSRHIDEQRKRMQGRAPLGMVFHLVPSNVPTVAFYSWLMALLMGNPCVVRLSSRIDPVQEAMLAILQELFSQPEWHGIASRTRFIRYGHDEAVTAWLSACCRLRIVWGGDETIRQIRAIPLSPAAQEMVFPDRRSMAVLDSEWLTGLDPACWQQTMTALQQDCTRFNQQACASPTMLCWLGTPDEALRQRLLEYVFFPFNNDPALTMERLIQCQMNAAMLKEGAVAVFAGSVLLTLPSPVNLPHIGGGMASEWVADGWEAVQAVDWNVQTCVYVGADICSARDQLRIATGRIDRVVTPGQALAFEWFWDGVDMLGCCSRVIR